MNTPTQTPAFATHTPTPWHVGMKPGPFIYGPQGEQVADMTGACTFNGKQDAAYIVKACNSHAQLVAALEDLLRNATDKERYISILEGTDVETSEQADELLDSPEMKRARAVLQAAKE